MPASRQARIEQINLLVVFPSIGAISQTEVVATIQDYSDKVNTVLPCSKAFRIDAEEISVDRCSKLPI
jgi:hypothetical protein